MPIQLQRSALQAGTPLFHPHHGITIGEHTWYSLITVRAGLLATVMVARRTFTAVVVLIHTAAENRSRRTAFQSAMRGYEGATGENR